MEKGGGGVSLQILGLVFGLSSKMLELKSLGRMEDDED